MRLKPFPHIPWVFLGLLFAGLFFDSCAEEEEHSPPTTSQNNPIDPREEQQESGCERINGQKTLKIGDIGVDIWVPKGTIKGDLLLLPRWNGAKSEWCTPLKICKQATRLGYRLIMPEMAKSIYAHQYFPETREDWRRYPTLGWVSDTLIPTLQNDYCILKEGRRNFLVGIASGARGAILLSLEQPDLFIAIAGLSGDYDQTQMTNDNLIRGFYGSYEDFPERWKGSDNPLRQAPKFRTPIFLSHGRDDEVVSPQQSRSFYDALRSAHPGLNVQLEIKRNMRHDMVFWSQALDESLAFFARFQEDKGAEQE